MQIALQEIHKKPRKRQKAVLAVNPSNATGHQQQILSTVDVPVGLPRGRPSHSESQQASAADPDASSPSNSNGAPSASRSAHGPPGDTARPLLRPVLPPRRRKLLRVADDDSVMRIPQHQERWIKELGEKHTTFAPNGKWQHDPRKTHNMCSMGTALEYFYLKSVVMWDPPSCFPHVMDSLVMPCVTCGSTSHVVRKGWYRSGPRQIQCIDQTILLWGRLYHCEKCHAESILEQEAAKREGRIPTKIQHYFLSYDERSISRLPDKCKQLVQDQFPFVLTHRAGEFDLTHRYT